ncbi:MAG: M20/M25/M40 family metallo-hydrolase [Acidobacteria bacterium]|nr:MAG: M20/M25/M40 family metallo-hydrolase [Acidobacteriota bacterium]
MRRDGIALSLILSAALLAAAAGPAAAGDAVAAARAYRQANGAEILARYVELLEIPNVARDLDNVERNAEWIRQRLAARGVAAELWRIEGVPPIVYGRLEVPGAQRTVGIYVHYDGQPVDRDQWTFDPWTPVLTTAALEDGGVRRPLPRPGEPIDPEWRLYARSSGDDKAPIPAILAALDALRQAGIQPTSNLVFFFEGEEEAGSEHLGDYMRAHRRELAVDLWLICDGPVHPSRRPQLVFGVRGYTGFDLTVYGAGRYLHSGHYGNWAPNPAMMLARLLASMKDDRGDVTIAGFYDDSAPLSDAERAAMAALPDYDDALRRELGLAWTEGDGASLAERLRRPSLNVRGMASAAVGEAARNVIPTTATASIDVRLVRGDDPEVMLDRVEEHVRRQGYHVVRQDPDLETRLRYARIARIDRRPGYKAAGAPLDAPVVQPVIAAARRVAGDELVLMPTLGGSLPLYLFTELLAAPVVIVPIANHDDNQHAPDENLRLANLWYGIDLMAALFTME